jgi:16S rRNA (cytosine967-C5)-methyltransferase
VAEHRARLVEQAVRGLPVTVLHTDGRTVGADRDLPEGGFDRVLVDAPCTGLGALRRRPEARWRRSPNDVAELVTLQHQLLTSAVELVRPGGVVVYSTCSPHPAETAGVVDRIVAELPVTPLDTRELVPGGIEGLGNGPTVQLWPHLHGTDAMFFAALRKD